MARTRRTRRTKRTIRKPVLTEGERFRILARDYFRCVLCGASPATDPSCVLHVDHIVPVSLGGPTERANLRTLCARCNLGRGNRYRV